MQAEIAAQRRVHAPWDFRVCPTPGTRPYPLSRKGSGWQTTNNDGLPHGYRAKLRHGGRPLMQAEIERLFDQACRLFRRRYPPVRRLSPRPGGRPGTRRRARPRFAHRLARQRVGEEGHSAWASASARSWICRPTALSFLDKNTYPARRFVPRRWRPHRPRRFQRAQRSVPGQDRSPACRPCTSTWARTWATAPWWIRTPWWEAARRSAPTAIFPPPARSAACSNRSAPCP